MAAMDKLFQGDPAEEPTSIVPPDEQPFDETGAPQATDSRHTTAQPVTSHMNSQQERRQL